VTLNAPRCACPGDGYRLADAELAAPRHETRARHPSWHAELVIAASAKTGHISVTMKTVEQMPAGEFKAKCLAVLDRVARTKGTVIVTKHGRPVAQVAPIPPGQKASSLLGSVTYHGDIVAPLEEDWDVES
jgi:prevent-host-death family protein